MSTSNSGLLRELISGEAVTYVDIWCNQQRGFQANVPAAEYHREAAPASP
jgi:hypothetical protein